MKLINMVENKKTIVCVEENLTLGSLSYDINDYICITDIEYKDTEVLKLLINRLVVLTFHLNKSYFYIGENDLSLYHFIKDNNLYYLDINKIKIRRFVHIGKGMTGKKNNLCDVPDIEVSHFTVRSEDGSYNTGLSIIKPHKGNVFQEKVIASSYTFNGFGKTIGLVQVEELGTIETNIVLTTTLNAGRISDAVIKDSLDKNPDIAVKTGTVNPIVMECNDGDLNNSRMRILGRLSYKKALEELDEDFIQGDIGAGTGMICHGFKGGIGSSSRIVNIDNHDYTIAILLNSNFGESNGKSLIFKGRYLGDSIKEYLDSSEDKGSIVAVFATDLPLNERQLKRVLKRIEIGIGRTGSYAGNGSGDVFIGFTTENKVQHYPDEAIKQVSLLSDDKLNLVFKRTVEMTEEAVLNSLLFSHHCKGYLKEVKALNEVNELFADLFEEEVDYEV